MRTGRTQDHQQLQKGAHHDGEFCTGDPGPIVAPRRPQEEEFPLNVTLSMDPHTLYLSGSSCLVPMAALGIMTGMNVNQKNCSLGAHGWPSTEIWTSRGTLPAMRARSGLNHSCAVRS